MPYFITNTSAECSGWAVTKEDGEVMGCHTSKASAVKQMVAISLVEDMEPGGERGIGDPKAILVDVDDTLIHMGQPMQSVIDAINAMDGRKIVITARPASRRAETVKQLQDAGFNYTAIYLKDQDMPTPAWKASIAQRLLGRYEIVLAVDNDEANRKAFRELGIETMNPANLSNRSFAVRDAGDWELLNERQQEQAEEISGIALKYGQFDQSGLSNGAHYAPAADNPFKADGLVCDNCIFYNETTSQCQIVGGNIEPEAVCKLWIIPESKIGQPINETPEEETMNRKRDNGWRTISNDRKATSEH